MKIKKVILLFAFFNIALFSTFRYSYADASIGLAIKKTAAISAGEIIIVGDDIDYPPYSFLDKKGNPAGFNIELAQAALETMGLKAEFRLGSWKEVRRQLTAGEIHMISGMFYSPEREKAYDFTTRHTVTSGDIFTREKKKISDIKELEGQTVVVQEDDIIYEHLVNQNLNIAFVSVPTVAEALRLVSVGKYDYAAVLKVPGHYIIDDLGFWNLRANDVDILQNDYCMAVRKYNDDLLFALNGGLKILKATGQYQEIYDKWLGVYEDKSFWEEVKEYAWLIGFIMTSLILLIFVVLILRRMVAIRTKELEEANRTLNKNQKELNAYNQEVTMAYQQLTASEEELRAQYDEIQSYIEKLENLKQKYQIAIQGTNSVVWEYDLEDKTIYLSEEFKSTYGVKLNEKEKIEIVFNELFRVEEKEKLIKEFIDYKEGKKEEIYSQVKIRDKDNQQQWILVRGKGVLDENRELKVINGIILDITKLKEQEEYIKHLAYHDPVTNLPNRIMFMEELEREISENQCGAVMLLDLDNFKGVNDTLGHVYGDKLLKRVAEELLNIKDEKLFISRFGGDEFQILVKRETEATEIENYAKRISKIFEERLMIKEETYVSCSIGITLYPFDSNDVTQLIMNADIAMYDAKNSGKSNYKFFNQKMTDKLKEKIQIETTLREAIKKEELKLLYQPQVCGLTGKVVGFEALLRLKFHPISPAIFIPVAEEAGIIIDMGRWVTKEVIKQIAVWKEKGINTKPVAINFSAKQLNDFKYIDFLEDLLKKNNVTPKDIEIEITESIFLENKQETMIFLNNLKALGIKIALDDFGTGYSSLSYLTFLPVDKIKLDKSLNDKFLQLENIAVMESIISLAHSLNLKVVAEGIEDIEQHERLKLVKCDYIQGYLFSKPLEVEEAENIHDYRFLL
ncbi:EAL domain-containing protein [Clostridium formicaceticum]|uniref:Cyclic di-GMP phosphodiesterase Gmr n=1 Tax=Clostridium formicaceticum TaxID=1497 RepID=A0AAC9RKF8_9CLOT|nr:EAL domain-containing protein [Clostridium formicaceticum]AOY76591.1 hypothetical protein BJL90_12400 [Clostridium formicaceticum]ARE87010.1 Cyclic di-GMP phosphodiesterase Gmr [Clostridium formicaceticum]